MNAPAGRRSLAVNTVWGLGGRVFQAVLQVFVTPVVIHLLGAEAYGVVAFGGTLFAIVGVLDFAFAPLLQRALNQAEAAVGNDARDLVFSLQAASVALAVLIALGIGLASPWIAGHWLHAETLSPAVLTLAVVAMGAGIAAQWPGLLFASGLTALERQDLLVQVRTACIAVQSLGGVLLLWLVAPDPRLFLAWLAAIAACATAVLGVVLWRRLPPAPRRPRFVPGRLKPHLRFSGGNLVIGLQAAVLTQADKLIVVREAGLEAFAAYALAGFAAMTATAFTASPITASILPRMTQRVAAADRAGLAAVLHRTAQQVALALLPTAATLAAFAQPVLSAWLGRSSPLVAPVAFLLPWCLAGVAINALVSVPFLMELAHGRTGRVIRVNMVAAPLFALVCWLGVPRYGAAFAAGAFIVVNVGYVLVMVPLIFASALPGQYGRWLWQGVVLPGVLAILVAIAGRTLVPEEAALVAQLAASGLTGLVGLAACLLVLPEAQDTAATLYRRLRRRVDPAAR